MGPLKAFVQDADSMANAAMEFKTRPTYRLIMGVPGESSALEIAAGLGFPAEVLQQARKYMDEDWLNLAERLKSLTAERDRVSHLRAELAAEKDKAALVRQELERKSADLKHFEQSERKRMQVEQAGILRDTRREIENLVRRIKEQQASRETIIAAKKYVEERVGADSNVRPGPSHVRQEPPASTPDTEVQPSTPRPPVPSLPGDYVHSRTFARQGTVTEIEGSEAVVAFGNIKVRLAFEDLEVLHHPEPELPPVTVDETEEFDPRLNVRGLTQEDARTSLERFLDHAEMHGSRQISILHGKGTGALRTMIWDHLRRDKRVSEVRFGAPNEGGNGVTFVTLKA